MNLKVIFYVYGGYNILLGLSFVLIPAVVMQGAGITPTADLIVTQQIWGTALMGIGLIALTLRGADGNDALRETARSFIIVCLLVVGITVYHLAIGYAGPPIFLNIAINALAAGGIFMKTK